MRGRPRSVLIVANFFSAGAFTRSPTEGFADFLEQRGWRVARTPTSVSRWRRVPEVLNGALSGRYGAAWIDGYSGRAFSVAAITTLLASLRGRPVVLALQGGRLPDFARAHRHAVAFVFSRATRVVTPSRYLANELAWIRSDIDVVPNGIDLSRFAPAERSDRGVPKVLWLRAFHANYRPTLAVEVAQILRDLPGFHLTMVGPDKGDGSLDATRKLIDQLDLSAHVSLQGGVPHEEVPSLLADHTLFLNTTKYESFGMALMEAAAVGTVIVSAEAGEITRIWTDGVSALLCDGSPESLATAITLAVQEPERAEQISLRAREIAEAHQQDVAYERLLDALEDVARGR